VNAKPPRWQASWPGGAPPIGLAVATAPHTAAAGPLPEDGRRQPTPDGGSVASPGLVALGAPGSLQPPETADSTVLEVAELRRSSCDGLESNGPFGTATQMHAALFI
jgi:hypothetical protein